MLIHAQKIKDLSKASLLTIFIGFLLLGGATVLFISLADDVLEKEKFAIDRMMDDYIETLRYPVLQQIMGGITEAGSVLFITIASIILFLFLLVFTRMSKWYAIFFAVNMLGVSLLTKVLKLFFERERPEILAEFDGTGFSFPSGHSTGAITFYGFLIYLLLISSLKSVWKWIINSGLVLATFTIALSRVFLQVHYFTDVVAGLAFGLVWLLICISGLELMLWRERR
ncbi:hypothetical protein J416_06430 [Gracilibacillus halophilus YIM-C55.5]|uniref:Phosphatidic acid phosphatase type 2/haloperoxidase domain-containing protein n=1 Tax=Gracilibacillus halophilus YIM-C55.5 TaxID=1308866 RepID=N4WD98_9BACI|nr:phosphatase PAP2 family protein [Gracilibacillus halophilus]ENH97249.1 hypothetical protein J416_06430 [Gracilibacillus halophilus YIM-C55.5]